MNKIDNTSEPHYKKPKEMLTRNNYNKRLNIKFFHSIPHTDVKQISNFNQESNSNYDNNKNTLEDYDSNFKYTQSTHVVNENDKGTFII